MKSKKVKPIKAAEDSGKTVKNTESPLLPQGKAVKVQAKQNRDSGEKGKANEASSATKSVVVKNGNSKGEKKKNKYKEAKKKRIKNKDKEIVISADKTRVTDDKGVVKNKSIKALEKKSVKSSTDIIKKVKSKNKTTLQIAAMVIPTAKKLSKKNDVQLIIEAEPQPSSTKVERVKANHTALNISSKPSSVGWKYFLDKQGFPLMKIYTENPGVFFKLEKLGDIKKSARYYSHKGDLVGADFIVPYNLIQTACTIAGIKAPKNLVHMVQQPLPQVL